MLDQLNQIIDDLGSMGYEVALAGGSIILLLVGMISNKIRLIQAVYVLVLLVAVYLLPLNGSARFLFGQHLVDSGLGSLLKIVFAVFSIWIVFYANAEKRGVEFYFLILAVLLGSSFMVSANHLLLIYLSVELASFSAYLLTNFDFRSRSFEAGIKYLIFGGVSSALSLYGASLMYGFTGTLTLSEMDMTLLAQAPLFKAGVLLFAGGLLFKISAVPFHIWVPGTYQLAPTEAVAVLSVVPKLAGFLILKRLFVTVNIAAEPWFYFTMGALGILTILVGTLGALRQTDVKRLMAYGAISHSGFLFAALLIPFANGAVAFLWYAIAYAIMNLAVFYLISIHEAKGLTDISDYAGRYKSDAYMGVLILIVMISLVGLPPLVGFTAKFYLFTVMWEWYQRVSDVMILTYMIIAVISVVFSLFFYLKIPYQYFLRDMSGDNLFVSSISQRVIATIFVISLLWLFFIPDVLNDIANTIKPIDW